MPSNKMRITFRCPDCKSASIETERRPDGYSTCKKCGCKAKTTEFNNCEQLPGSLVYIPPVPGLTKREYFAAVAMQGIMSVDPNIWARVSNEVGRTLGAVEMAVSLADELIEELNKENKDGH